MHYVDKLDFFDVEFMQNPCIKGEGAPTTSTEADVGFFYMNTLTGDVYKCITAADGIYTWEPLSQSSGGSADLTGYATEQWVLENYLTKNELIEPLYVAVTLIEDGYWACDTQYGDIVQAYNEERPVYCHVIVGDTTLRLTVIIVANDTVSFAATSPSGHMIVHINSDNVVLVVTVPIPTKPSDIGAQPAGNYLTEVPDGYAKTEDIPTKPEDIGAQPAGNYLTEVPDGYAKTSDIPTKPEDIGAQPAGNYLTEHQSLAGYATENYVKSQIAAAELSGGDVDLSGYATKDELPTKVSQLQNDSGYLTQHQSLAGYAKTEDIPTKPEDIGAQPAGNYLTEHQSLDGYAKTSDIPTKVSQLTNDKGYLTEHQSLSDYAKKSEIPTKPSDIGAQPAGNYLTEHQSLDGYAKTSDIPTKPEDIGAQPAGNYALKTELPNVPVQSVNGKTGAVTVSVPTKVSQLQNDSGFLTEISKEEIVQQVIASLPVYNGEVV